MREKFTIRNQVRLSEDNSSLILGIRYNKKSKEFVLGCPSKFCDESQDILETYFFLNVDMIRTRFMGGRMKYIAEMDLVAWLRGIRELKKDYELKKVERFGRLFR